MKLKSENDITLVRLHVVSIELLSLKPSAGSRFQLCTTVFSIQQLIAFVESFSRIKVLKSLSFTQIYKVMCSVYIFCRLSVTKTKIFNLARRSPGRFQGAVETCMDKVLWRLQ